MKFLKSKVEADTVATALEFQFSDPGGWKKMTAKDLGLSGSSASFFSSSVYADAGLEVYRHKDNPKNFVLKFSALPFAGVDPVFGHYLGNPPKFDTKYADEFAKIYAAVGKLAKGGEVIATGFSLGGLAVNQLADRTNAEFAQSKLSFVALGSEYVSKSSAQLVNIGAYNDWFFGAYNAYTKLYKPGDPGLKTITSFADTVFATTGDLKAIPASSFLKPFFSFDRNDSHLPNSVNWVFHFENGGNRNFVRDVYAEAHSRQAISIAVTGVMKAPFASELSLQSAVVFDLDTTANAVLDVASHLHEFAVSPRTIYTIGSNGASDGINGSKYSDRIAGMAGNDTLKGGAGDDRLYGGTGNDVVNGDAGADVLKGETGNDRLFGGAGADRLYGGSGADTFVFRSVSDTPISTTGRDTIYDFSQAQKDRIDLKVIDASTKLSGDQAFKFIGGEAFHKTAGELRYVKVGGDTLVHGDVNGDGKADFTVVVDASITFKAGDFIL